jgi:hypothetical protein
VRLAGVEPQLARDIEAAKRPGMKRQEGQHPLHAGRQLDRGVIQAEIERPHQLEMRGGRHGLSSYPSAGTASSNFLTAECGDAAVTRR